MEYGGGGGEYVPRAPPPGRGLNTSTLPPVKCYRCGGPNHMARYVRSYETAKEETTGSNRIIAWRQ
jgi:Zinc knuckle